MTVPGATARTADPPAAMLPARSRFIPGLPVAPRACHPAGAGLAGSCDGESLLQAFQASGGAATGTELAELLRPWADQPISRVARWIVSRQVVSFAWRADTLLPLFQFDLSRGDVRGRVHRVLLELSGALDEAEIALWFARPNVWLAGAAPANAILADGAAVLEAARADRFIAKA